MNRYHKSFHNPITAFILGCTIWSCTGNHTEKKEAAATRAAAPSVATVVKPPATGNDTLFVTGPAAVFYAPDSLQLEKLRSVTDSAVFDSNVHESYYQMRFGRITVRREYPGVAVIPSGNARFLCFRGKEGNTWIKDLNAINDPWGIILSDGRKPPQLTDMTNIETELWRYFGKEFTSGDPKKPG